MRRSRGATLALWPDLAVAARAHRSPLEHSLAQFHDKNWGRTKMGEWFLTHLCHSWHTSLALLTAGGVHCVDVLVQTALFPVHKPILCYP